MNYKLIVSISVSLLKARLKQTLIAAFGVTFSITMFIALLSFMSGLNDLLDNLILNRTAHIRLYNEMLPTENQPILLSNEYKYKVNFIRNIKPKQEFLSIKNSKSIIAYLQKDKAVLGVAPKLIVPIYMNVGMVNLSAVINGIDVDAESKLFSFQDYLSKGNVNELKNIPNSVVIGTGLAEKMLVQIGDNIKISTVNNDQFVLKVVGFFQSGIAELDKVQCYTTLETSQKIIGESRSYLTDLQIKLNDINQAPQLSKKYSQLFSVEAIDIQTANAQFETGSSVRTLISYAVGITLLIVAGFGIYNILNMMIYDKMDSIAILKATGFSGKDVNRIFIIIAIIIGIVGGLLGLILGFLVSYLISFIPFETASLPTVKTYPISYIPKFYLIGALFSLITTYFAGYFPSRKASKIDPVDIIRGKIMEMDKIIEAKNIGKVFFEPKEVKVLNDVSLTINKGEFVSIIGKSGCGKSTLLYILSTMDTQYTGELAIDGISMKNKKDAELAHIRNEKIGFVFQFHYLLNEFNVLANIMLPGLKLMKKSKAEIEFDAYEKLKILGIENEALKLPNQLSGGQKQRVAIARALINNPLIIMGDEPTGNLDKKNSDIVFSTFKELAEEFNQSLLIVTHDSDFANKSHRIIEMEDGKIKNG